MVADATLAWASAVVERLRSVREGKDAVDVRRERAACEERTELIEPVESERFKSYF